MSYIDEAGGMVVKLALDGTSYAVRIAGQGASALTGAFIKLAAAGFEGLKSQDKEYIKGLLKSGEGVGLYSIPPDKEKGVKKLLKEYKVPYVFAEGKSGEERMLMTGISNASVIEHIFEKLGIVPQVAVDQKKKAPEARVAGEPEEEAKKEEQPDLASQMWGEEEKAVEEPGPEPGKPEQDRREPEEGRSESSSGSMRKEHTNKSPEARNETSPSISRATTPDLRLERKTPGTSSPGQPENTLSPFSREAKEAAAREGRKPSLRKALNTVYKDKAQAINAANAAAREAARGAKEAVKGVSRDGK